MKNPHYILTVFIVILMAGLFSGLSGCGSSGGGAFTVTVSGNVSYEDKEYDTAGFTGRTAFYKAVRYAAVEIVDSISGIVLADGVTNSSGQYSITFDTKSLSVYVRVIAISDSSVTSAVELRNLYGALYSVAGADMKATSSELSADLIIPSTNAAAGAFNILDVFITAGEFIYSLEGAHPPLIKAFWGAGNGYGTYFCIGPDPYCPQGDGIYILGGSSLGVGDTDEYDDDVLWHEYGHFAAEAFSKDDSPGGVHYLTDNDIDLRLTWSEGWSHFFMAAVKEWLADSRPALLSTAEAVAASAYIDTYDSAAWKFDIAQPEAFMVYASNEVAVANVLWETMRSASAGMNGLWDVFAEYIPFVSDPVNLEALWDGWLFLDLSDLPEKPVLDNIFLNRQIRYSVDAYESDSSINPSRKTFVGAPSEFHTLYDGDNITVDARDFIAFDVISGQAYTLETSNLRNGADTYLNLLDPDGYTLVASNDNASGLAYTYPYNCSYATACSVNDNTTLSSSISFTAYTTSTFYAEVFPPPDRPLSAGRYGSYMFSISNF